MDFVLLENPLKSLEILKERLPMSVNVYNLAIMKSDYGDLLEFYELNFDPNGLIIMAKFERKDYGISINISTPVQFRKTQEIMNIFANSKYIDWTQNYIFSSISSEIYSMFVDISVLNKKNITSIYPKILYYLPQAHNKMDIIKGSSAERLEKMGLTLKSPMDLENGVEFFLKTWKYSKEGSRIYLKQILLKSLTCGIYVDDKPICGVCLGTNGHIAFLYTNEDFRALGLAQICLQNLCQKMLSKGQIPCSNVEPDNEASEKLFHKKLGFLKHSTVFYINYLSDSN